MKKTLRLENKDARIAKLLLGRTIPKWALYSPKQWINYG